MIYLHSSFLLKLVSQIRSLRNDNKKRSVKGQKQSRINRKPIRPVPPTRGTTHTSFQYEYTLCASPQSPSDSYEVSWNTRFTRNTSTRCQGANQRNISGLSHSFRRSFSCDEKLVSQSAVPTKGAPTSACYCTNTCLPLNARYLFGVCSDNKGCCAKKTLHCSLFTKLDRDRHPNWWRKVKTGQDEFTLNHYCFAPN